MTPNSHIKSIADILLHNDRMIKLGLTDLNNHDANQQARAGDGSSIYWILGHLLESRHKILNMLQPASDNPYSGTFGRGTIAAADASNTDVVDLLRAWSESGSRIQNLLTDLTPDKALAEQTGHPTPDQTLRGALTFRAWHESYHIGQIGLMLTGLDKTAMATRLRSSQMAMSQ
jgi:uncharacterized damage-inducible protein DinB